MAARSIQSALGGFWWKRALNLHVALLSLLMPITGCSFDAPGNTSIDEHREDTGWVAASGGGFFRRTKAMHLDEATRCWKKQANFTCLRITDLYQEQERYGNPIYRGYQLYEVSDYKIDLTSPGQAAEAAAENLNGYQCHSAPQFGLFVEQIDRDGKTLIENTSNIIATPWSQHYVSKFMADNGLDNASAWFPCFQIHNAIRNGSLETLNTTIFAKPI